MLITVSAGFDAAEGDSLGCCNVTPPAYGHMTHMLCALAGGKVVVALEVGPLLSRTARLSYTSGRIQSRRHIPLLPRCRPGPSWGDTCRNWSTRGIRGGYRGHVSSGQGAIDVLEEHRCERLRASRG